MFVRRAECEQDWVWITPGSILTTILFGVVFSLGARLYATRIGDYAATYGALAGAAILLLWMYLTEDWRCLIGGELDGVIEHAANPSLRLQWGAGGFTAFARTMRRANS